MLSRYIGDVRSLRRRVEAEVQALHGKVQPAFYEVRFASGAPALGRASLQLARGDGPLVVCGLLETSIGIPAGTEFEVTSNGIKYTEQPVVGTHLFQQAPLAGAHTRSYGPPIEWARPIIVGAGDQLGVAATSAGTIADMVLLVGGFHTDEATAAELRRRGEFWAAGQTLDSTHLQQDFPFTRDVHALFLLRTVPNSNSAAVSAYTIEVGGRSLTPIPLRQASSGARSTWDPSAWVDLPCRRGQRWTTRVGPTLGVTLNLGLLGATTWVR